MAPYTLIIVDMQPRFIQYCHTNENLVDNCIDEVENAVKNNADVVVLEYENYGKTCYHL